MIAEIIGVGTELLLGQIVNTNAQKISQMLASIGVDVLLHVNVGDNEARISEAIESAMSRSDAVIVTGGLGPTHDDLTREAIALATGRHLERRSDLEAWLRDRFARMGRQMAESNLRQCDLPQGAAAIDNPGGTAPGIYLEHDGKLLFALPGVPSEMESMMAEEVIPVLSRAAGGGVLVSRILKVAGIGESDLAATIRHSIEKLEGRAGPTIALLASPGEVKIRISAKASDEQTARSSIRPVEDELREALGELVFGSDDDTLEAIVGDLLKSKGKTLAVAESFTGGMVISRLIEVPGISEILLAGYVTYSIASKERDLGIEIGPEGAVSEKAVRMMAEGVRRKTGASLGIATTGEAGPKPAEAPVGTVFLGLASEEGTFVRHYVAPGSRLQVRQWGTQGALNLLRLHLMAN